jgi:hypothetical protein
VGWLGVFIAPTTKLAVWWRLTVVWCTGQSGAHRTCLVRQPCHPAVGVLTVGALTAGSTGMSGGAPNMHCRVSGAPAWACLTSAHAGAHLMRLQVAIGAEVAVAPLSHRTCPVNYSRLAVVNSRSRRVQSRVPLEHRTLSSVHRTVR